MRMQEPEQWQTFDETGATNQEYGAYRVGAEDYEQEQKVYPQNSRSVGTLITIFSAIGFSLATAGIVGSAMVLSKANGSSYLLTGGILGLIGSILALLCLVAIFVLSVISETRRAAHYRRPHSR